MYKSLLKPFFFLLRPERAHHLTLSLLKVGLAFPLVGAWLRHWVNPVLPDRPVKLFGLEFPNAVGLAAGFDKDGKHLRAMSALGFGFLEIGTVTPLPQPGNPQPRLFRLPADGGLINRMGFNNEGVEALVSRLKKYRRGRVIIGGNIGKNKITPNASAQEDYDRCFEALFPYVDYFVVNVSSPNTPNLRELQAKEPLRQLLQRLQTRNRQKDKPKPILLKIAPDLTKGQLDDIIEIVRKTDLAGLIATNTTISRSNLDTPASRVEKMGAGGLSGAPLRERSTEVIRYINEQAEGSIPIIGVGGISNPEDALEKLKAGASLVQVYTGMVYYGPTLIRDIRQALLQLG